MKYRSRTDIVAQILEAATGGATKTKIMYKAYLSYAQLKEYLAMMTENGLIELDKKTLMYRITAKGSNFVNKYKSISGDMAINERVETVASPAR